MNHTSYSMWYLYPHRRITEANPHTERALALDPLSPFLRVHRARQLWLTGNYEASAAAVRQVLELTPHHLLALNALAGILAANGRFEEATEAAQQAVAAHGRSVIPLGTLGMAHAMAGRKEEARAILAEMEQRSRDSYVPGSLFALIHICLGEIDAAFAWANRAIDQYDPLMLGVHFIPLFEPLRADPRYPSLLARMNLT